jgi:UDP-glucuronate 4-epimerase
MDKPILVTGANGLIGHAVAAALARNNRPVVGLVRRQPEEDFPFDIAFADFTDLDGIQRLFSKRAFEAVVHSGAVSGPMVGVNDPLGTVTANIMGTANILEACRIHGVKRVVYTSSTTAYGNTPPAPVTEEYALLPNDVYGATKAAGEALVRSYVRQHGLEGVSLRISWVYGPRRVTDCLIRTLIQDALSNRPTYIDYGIGFHRQYVHVEDVASAILAALNASSYPKDVYNVTGGDYSTLDEVAAIVGRLLPDAEIHMKPGPDPVDTIQEEFDISAIHCDFGFTPRIGLEEGIGKYIEWLRGHGSNADG